MIEEYVVNMDLEQPANANVADMYRESTLQEIRADLDTKRTGLVSIFMNLTHDFNKASGIRANNAFSGNSVYMVGARRYNRKGAVGTYQYEHVFHADTLEELVEKLHADGYKIFAVDNIASYDPENIWDVDMPEKSAFVYGEEQRGLGESEINLCDGMVYISQTGSVRSLNVAQAAAVVMAEYSRRFRI